VRAGSSASVTRRAPAQAEGPGAAGAAVGAASDAAADEGGAGDGGSGGATPGGAGSATAVPPSAATMSGGAGRLAQPVTNTSASQAQTATPERATRPAAAAGAVIGSRPSSAQRGEDLDRAASAAPWARAASTTGSSLQRRKGLIRALARDRRRQRRQAGVAQRPALRGELGERAIGGLDRVREAQVGQRVLVRAAHAGAARQRRQPPQRGVHLRRRALEQAPAAAAEQRVAAEQQRRAPRVELEVGDVAGGVPGHVQDLEAPAEHLDHVALGSGTKGSGIASPAGPHTGTARRARSSSTPPTWSAWWWVTRMPARRSPCAASADSTGAASPGSTTSACRPSCSIQM
jgi:hypothetical protein